MYVCMHKYFAPKKRVPKHKSLKISYEEVVNAASRRLYWNVKQKILISYFYYYLLLIKYQLFCYLYRYSIIFCYFIYIFIYSPSKIIVILLRLYNTCNFSSTYNFHFLEVFSTSPYSLLLFSEVEFWHIYTIFYKSIPFVLLTFNLMKSIIKTVQYTLL